MNTFQDWQGKMDTIPDIYIRIYNFNQTFELYKKLIKEYDKNSSNNIIVLDIMNCTNHLYTYYWKYISDIYKEQNKFFTFPREIINNALNGNVISVKMKFLLEYIDDYSSYVMASKNEHIKIAHKIVNKYRKKFPLMTELMHSKKITTFMKQYEPLTRDFYESELILDNTQPKYISDELGISEKSYRILIEFFKSNSYIKSVWLYGSRLYGGYSKGSDIDLIIDCPIDKSQELTNDILALPIPYFVDFLNINNINNRFFLQAVANKGTKKIY